MTDYKKLYLDANTTVINQSNPKSSIYEDFLATLTSEKIKQFNSDCKKKQLNLKQTKSIHDHLGSKLPKEYFISLLNTIFGYDLRKSEKKDETAPDKKRKTDNREKLLTQLFEKMFNRFKIVKCEISSEKNKTNPSEHFYHINEFNTEQHQEIDTWEFSCALCIFLKIDFKEKLKLLFELTDTDGDNYLNESEIKNLIFVINFIFCDEDPSDKTNSSIINQSLNNIKSLRIFEAILKYPGCLNKILSVEKYVNFEQLYESITKIENYKYNIIPTFINFEKSLNTKKSEPELEISEINMNDYLSILNENVSKIKDSHNEYFFKTKFKDLKKIYEAKRDINMTKIIKKKKEYISENKKNIKSTTSIRHNKLFTKSGNSDNDTPKNSLPIIAKYTRGEKEKILSKSKDTIDNDNFSLNFNQILNLEAQPGKIKLRDLMPREPSKDNLILRTEESKMTSKFFNTIKLNNTQQTKENNDWNKKNFVFVNDILNEIKLLSNKNNVAHYEDSEEVKKLLSKSIQTANYLKNKFKDTAQNMSLSFGIIGNKNYTLKYC